MKLKLNTKIVLALFIMLTFSSNKIVAQCFQIESILVDACGADEGLNEMVRFKVGGTALNTSNMTVEWAVAAVDWEGLIQNATTASKVAALNADIVAAGGCGQLLEPTAGVLPANATVILVTSFNLDTALNSFGALTETIYIIFQNNPSEITGHFTNFGVGMRTLQIKFGASCTDTVTYNRALLTNQVGINAAEDGATVLFTPAGVATYVNYGCSAPVNPFTVDAGAATMTACAGTTIALNGTAAGQDTVMWSAPSGAFSASSSLATNFIVPASASGQVIVITLTAVNSCGALITDTINLTVTASVTPAFSIPITLCTGSTAPLLPTTSTNGITGTWNPSTINNTTSGTYTFTPNAGQCATTFTLNVTVSTSIAPTFTISTTLCTGSTAPLLPTTSTNGITGTWSPSTIDNTTSGTYTFTPNAGQCATTFTLNVTVSTSIAPTFTISTTLCSGSTAPALPTTSTNGITGTWSPSTIDNTTSGTYTFTPNAGQCATTFTLNVTVSTSIAPTFTISTTICSGSTAPALPTTSTNGITGTWNPSTINNTTSGTYTFTPNAGQCATTFTLNVTVSTSIAPTFTISTTICSGSTAPVLPTTSTNGITGTWNPSTIDNITSGTYTFTPNAGQCATTFTLEVTISNFEITFEQNCKNGDFIVSVLPLNNSFNPENVTYLWKNAQGTVVGMNESQLNISELVENGTVVFPATYQVTVFSDEGCSVSADVIVYGAFCKIPKGISPNNDGANESFDLTGLGVDEIYIYNRYGTEVFHKKNYTNEWYGQSDQGHELPAATYFYVLRKNNNETVTGWVYVIR